MSDYGKRGHDEMMDNAAEISRLKELIGESARRHSSLVKQHGEWFTAAPTNRGDHETAEDVCQAVFVLLFRKASTMKKGGFRCGLAVPDGDVCGPDTLKLARRAGAGRSADLAKAAGDPWESWQSTWMRGWANFPIQIGALLLRFENRSLRDVGQAPRMNDDTAPKAGGPDLGRHRRILVNRGGRFGGRPGNTCFLKRSPVPCPPPLRHY